MEKIGAVNQRGGRRAAKSVGTGDAAFAWRMRGALLGIGGRAGTDFCTESRTSQLTGREEWHIIKGVGLIAYTLFMGKYLDGKVGGIYDAGRSYNR